MEQLALRTVDDDATFGKCAQGGLASRSFVSVTLGLVLYMPKVSPCLAHRHFPALALRLLVYVGVRTPVIAPWSRLWGLPPASQAR
jgi:hypothetical protein